MADITTATAAPASGFNLALAGIGDYIKRSDLGLALGIMAILVVLILPLPT